MTGGEMRIPYVIGEFGSCHEETQSRALQGIEVAAAAGIDAYKVQYFSSPVRMRERRHIPEPSGQYDQGSISAGWFSNLRDKCHSMNISFACSVYLPEDVEIVSKYVDVFKVSSFEARDKELIDAITEVQGERPFFISTGMQEDWRESKRRSGIYLHCVSAYPCPMEEASLGAIEFGEGYSDHTRCVLTGGLAVASGANFLEVHYRLDSTSEGCPDYPVSLSPQQLAQYVEIACTAALARGTGEKMIMESEKVNLKYRVGV